MKHDYDIEFDGKRYKKEEFVYYPSKEPNKRMRYRSAFYELWKTEKAKRLGKGIGEVTSHETSEKFTSYFFKLYAKRKIEKNPITWDDFKNLEL